VRRLSTWTSAAILCGLAVSFVGGQASARREYSVTGTVIGIDAAPVGKAEVSITEAGQTSAHRLQTDTLGHFSAAGLTSSSLVIRVRAFGYTPRATSVVIAESRNQTSVTISLEPLATELAEADITAAGADADRKLTEYYARKSNSHFAHFIDAEDIAHRKPQFTSEMTRTIPGVALTGFGRVGNVLTIRGCAPLVWVDGVRMPGAQLDDVAPPDDVARIEIYNSFAGIPARYFDRSATCGTILVWLKS